MSEAIALENIDELFSLFEQYGNEHYGEGVSQSLHMRQCATLAEQENAGDALIAAALLHDIGHFHAYEHNANYEQDFHHERVGATMLDTLFPKEVTDPIRLHVAAKRYLCAKDDSYLGTLSEASKQSLAVQGGPMTEKQMRSFEQSNSFNDALALRRYDDEGKKIDQDSAPLSYFRPLLERLIKN
jgi:phosphonate degradation associated HDIG domain protein